MVTNVMNNMTDTEDIKWLTKKHYELESKVDTLSAKLALNINTLHSELTGLKKGFGASNKNKIEFSGKDKIIFWLIVAILTMAGVVKNTDLNPGTFRIFKEAKR